MERFSTRTARAAGGDSTRARFFSDIVTAEEFVITGATPSTFSAPPNSEVTISVNLVSTEDTGGLSAIDVDQDHPDYCDDGALIGVVFGADLFVRVNGAATTQGGRDCYNVEDNNTKTVSIPAVLQNSEGVQQIEVELVGAATQTVYDSTTVEINVQEDAPGEEPPPGNGGGGGDDDRTLWEIIFGQERGSSLLGTEQTIALAAFSVLLIVAFSAAN